MQRPLRIKITTPAGTAQWPKLNEPDTKFDKEGVYSVSLRITKEESEPIVSKISNVLNSFIEDLKKDKPKLKKIKMATLPIKDVEDDDGNPTGEVEIKFKMKAVGGTGKDRWEQRPVLFDSKGKRMKENVGGGSKIKVGAEAVPFYTPAIGAGVTLRLKAVQVLDLRTYTKGDSFDSWSFSEEDGFVSSTEETVKATTEEAPEDGFDF